MYNCIANHVNRHALHLLSTDPNFTGNIQPACDFGPRSTAASPQEYCRSLDPTWVFKGPAAKLRNEICYIGIHKRRPMFVFFHYFHEPKWPSYFGKSLEDCNLNFYDVLLQYQF